MTSRRKKPRRIRPHERARIDQNLAWARNVGAADPTTRVIVCEWADPGVDCCWCDCPLEDHARRGNVGCPGCQTDALYVVHASVGSPHQSALPVCERHRDEVDRLLVSQTASVTLISLYGMYDQ